MSNFEKIKRYYNMGIYKEKHIKIFYQKKVITKEQYNEILGIAE